MYAYRSLQTGDNVLNIHKLQHSRVAIIAMLASLAFLNCLEVVCRYDEDAVLVITCDPGV